jgi:hypothetical protein
MKITTAGMDLAKNVIQVQGVDARGNAGHPNIAAVALANKNARIVWALFAAPKSGCMAASLPSWRYLIECLAKMGRPGMCED